MRLKATETGQHLYAVREYLHGKVETHYFEWEYQAINYRARVAEKKFNLLKFVLKITNQVFVKLSRCPESLVLHFLQKYFTRLLFDTIYSENRSNLPTYYQPSRCSWNHGTHLVAKNGNPKQDSCEPSKDGSFLLEASRSKLAATFRRALFFILRTEMTQPHSYIFWQLPKFMFKSFQTTNPDLKDLATAKVVRPGALHALSRDTKCPTMPKYEVCPEPCDTRRQNEKSFSKQEYRLNFVTFHSSTHPSQPQHFPNSRKISLQIDKAKAFFQNTNADSVLYQQGLWKAGSMGTSFLPSKAHSSTLPKYPNSRITKIHN